MSGPLTSTGVCDQYGPRRIQSKKAGAERLVEVRDAVVAAAQGSGATVWTTDLVVLEGYSYGSPNQAHPIGELGGVVRVGLWEAGIPFHVVAPTTIKMFACGKGNAKKEDVLLAAVRRLDYAGNSTDEADALWLYALAMHALGSPQVAMPADHLRALKTLDWKLPSKA